MTNEEEDKVVVTYADYTKMKVDSSYQGVHLVKPFTKSQLNTFVNSLKSKNKKVTIICRVYCIRIQSLTWLYIQFTLLRF